MTTKTMSHPLVSSAFFILSRTLLYAALWFALWTTFDYLRTSGGFRLKVSADYIMFYLFVGWLFALLNWKAGGDKIKRPE
jgi:hypothetical protein